MIEAISVEAAMPAETFRCPSCGAAVSSQATRCDFCKAILATVTCPSCFGLMFAGAKFCSHCGAKGNRSEASGDPRLCPRCKIAMSDVAIGTTSLLECSQCEGIWVDVESLQQICVDREKQAFASSVPSALERPLELEKMLHYVPCPACHELMNRVQFAQCSHVIVDVCKPHGTWFDKDELQRAVQFIRAGGLEKARAMQLEQLKEEQRKLAVARLYNSSPDPVLSRNTKIANIDLGSSAIALLFDLLT
jgi:Zn-finger nucleic acid-binding protein/predicted RNA-binding Zn-ribbon protein involved in translation (DUF1610 family)